MGKIQKQIHQTVGEREMIIRLDSKAVFMFSEGETNAHRADLVASSDEYKRNKMKASLLNVTSLVSLPEGR